MSAKNKPTTGQLDTESAGAVVKREDLTDLFDADAGAGFEENALGPNAFSIPFLTILQALSPQVQPGPNKVQGAEPGMIINLLTKELFRELECSVVRRDHSICTWVKREKGGGFIGEEEATVEALQEFMALPQDDKKRRIDSDDHERTEHRTFFLHLLRDEGPGEPGVISMTKSQLKPARDWNYLINLKCDRKPGRMPTASSEIWRLGTALRTKDGNSWYTWTIAHVGRHTNRQVYAAVSDATKVAKELKLLARPVPEDDAPVEASGEV